MLGDVCSEFGVRSSFTSEFKTFVDQHDFMWKPVVVQYATCATWKPEASGVHMSAKKRLLLTYSFCVNALSEHIRTLAQSSDLCVT